ncbi:MULTISPECIES: GlsB/YeaQ/YmgE family stress response membrane protein [unclassified Sphingomonas]|uniref:GlsB/YeaQ/YmgE family stress response membrane protein n=1 Tax=unclassified Sphingomonas TaxID=196159 RepID=UPI0035A81CB6
MNKAPISSRCFDARPLPCFIVACKPLQGISNRRFIQESVATRTRAGKLTIRRGPMSRGRRAMLLQNSFFGWILIGLVAGVLGKIILPGKDPGGFIVTILIGIAGALLAGFVSQSMGWQISSGWQSYAAATGGAIVLLILYRIVVTKRTAR